MAPKRQITPFSATPVFFAATALALSACGSRETTTPAAPADAGPYMPAYAIPPCGMGETAMPDGMGGHVCTVVGAVSAGCAEWPPPWPEPDPPDLPMPIAYVRAGGTGGGSNPLEPTGDLQGAVNGGAATVVISSGEYRLIQPLTVERSVLITGMGPTGCTSLLPQGGVDGIVVQGASAMVELRSVDVRYEGGRGTAIAVRDGATLNIDNVSTSNAGTGLLVAGGTLTGRRLTIRLAGMLGLSIESGAAALTDVAVRQSLFGVFVTDGQLALSDSAIEDNTRDGLSFEGGSSTHSLERVAIHGNGLTGIRASRPTVEVDATAVSIANTRRARDEAGYGLYVFAGATVRLDADHEDCEARGQKSSIIGNQYLGALVEGMNTQLVMHGGTIGTNGGPGVFVHDRGSVDILATRIEDNVGLGVGGFDAREITIACSDLSHTRTADFDVAGTIIELGDGFSAVDGVEANLENNQIDGNTRFGAVISGGTARLMGNAGTQNLWGYANYGATVQIDRAAAISGQEGAPADPPPFARAVPTVQLVEMPDGGTASSDGGTATDAGAVDAGRAAPDAAG